MTVKIVKKKPDPSIIKRIPCGNCGMTLEYVPNDVKEYNGTDYSGGSDGVKWIDCPNCKKKVILETW